MPSSLNPRRQRNALAGWFVASIMAVTRLQPSCLNGYLRMERTAPGLAQRGDDVTNVISIFGSLKLLKTAAATILPLWMTPIDVLGSAISIPNREPAHLASSRSQLNNSTIDNHRAGRSDRFAATSPAG